MSQVSDASMRIINNAKNNLNIKDTYLVIAAIQTLAVVRDEYPKAWDTCVMLYGTLLNDLFVD